MPRSKDVLMAYKQLILTSPPSLLRIIELVKLVLTISVSTAEVERGFSCLNRIKSDTRATMTQDCLRSLMMVKGATPDVDEYSAEETQVLKIWETLKNRRPSRLTD